VKAAINQPAKVPFSTPLIESIALA